MLVDMLMYQIVGRISINSSGWVRSCQVIGLSSVCICWFSLVDPSVLQEVCPLVTFAGHLYVGNKR